MDIYMSVPPTGRPSSTPPSKGKPEESKDKGKDFKLPSRKGQVSEKEEQLQKQKGLFDLAGQEAVLQEKQQSLSQTLKSEDIKTSEVSATEAKAQVTQIGQIIQKTVESMRIGQLEGKDLATLELKKTADVPSAFQGSNLTVSYAANGVKIHFDNFMSPQQQNTAITLVEKNKDQLQQMVQALNAKHIQVTELSIGTHTVALPRVEPLPPPFQPSAAAETETRQQREGQKEGREGGEEGPR
jgi:hypothetical protein